MRTKLLILLSFLFSGLNSQTIEKRNNLWISGGLGFHGSSYLAGVSIFSSLNYSRSFARNKYILAELRYMKHIGLGDEDNHSYFDEFDILPGISFGEALQFRISAGLGLIDGAKYIAYNRPGYYEDREEKISSLGFTLELGLNLVPVRYFGLGIKGFAHINPELPFYGAVVNIELGKVYGTKNPPGQETHLSPVFYKTTLGLKAVAPTSIGLSVKHFIKGNKALEGIISTRRMYEVYNLFSLTMLFEDERKLSSDSCINWFWGAGIHGSYGSKNTEDPYYSGFEQNISRIGLDAIIGIEYTFKNIPVNLSFDIIPSLDLAFEPWMSAGISVRYAFK